MNRLDDIHDVLYRMKRDGDPFAVATVVRTLSVTAAKPGSKAIIDSNGEIIDGWIGGGCARGAVLKAAKACIADGEPRFVSLQPDEILNEMGLSAGEQVDGRWMAKNMCPSKGTMDIFVEPFLANPEVIVVGSSPVAASLRQLSALFNFSVSVVGDVKALPNRDAALESAFDINMTEEIRSKLNIQYPQWSDVPIAHAHRYIVVATQGEGDLDALSSALGVQSRHIAFVGSRRKIRHLKDQLLGRLDHTAPLQRIKGPAGLDIGAVTPHEIALSILAELVQLRRKNDSLAAQ